MPAPSTDEPLDDRAQLEARGVRLQTIGDEARGNTLVDASIVCQIPIGGDDAILVVRTLHQDRRGCRHTRALLVALSGGRIVSFTLRGPALVPTIEALAAIHAEAQNDKCRRGLVEDAASERRFVRVPRVLLEIAARAGVPLDQVLAAATTALDELELHDREELIVEARRGGAR